MDEARMEQTEQGLVAATEGWFVVNVRDGAWVANEHFGDAFIIEGTAAPFPDLGYTLAVLRPGQTGGLYHREANQEDFFVLQGEATLIVEGEERPLKQWDFFHCPAGTEHIIVGAGDGPCIVFMAGGRTRGRDTHYPAHPVAARHGAAAHESTGESSEAYAPFPKWQDGRPPTTDLPWDDT